MIPDFTSAEYKQLTGLAARIARGLTAADRAAFVSLVASLIASDSSSASLPDPYQYNDTVLTAVDELADSVEAQMQTAATSVRSDAESTPSMFADHFRDRIFQQAQRIAQHLELNERTRMILEAGRCCAGDVTDEDVFVTRGGALGRAWDEWSAYVREQEAVWPCPLE